MIGSGTPSADSTPAPQPNPTAAAPRAVTDRPADRYGTSRKRTPTTWSRRSLIVLGAVLVLVVAAIAWLAFRTNTHPVDPDTVSYHVTDSTLVTVEVSVVVDPDRDITCAVQATNEYDAVVGYVELAFPADPQADSGTVAKQTVDVRTTQLASSGHLKHCWFD